MSDIEKVSSPTADTYKIAAKGHGLLRRNGDEIAINFSSDSGEPISKFVIQGDDIKFCDLQGNLIESDYCGSMMLLVRHAVIQ